LSQGWPNGPLEIKDVGSWAGQTWPNFDITKTLKENPKKHIQNGRLKKVSEEETKNSNEYLLPHCDPQFGSTILNSTIWLFPHHESGRTNCDFAISLTNLVEQTVIPPSPLNSSDDYLSFKNQYGRSIALHGLKTRYLSFMKRFF
jgi:hypothetical protein